MTEAVVYGYEGCVHCDRAKEMLADRGIPFTYRDVKADLSARADWFALTTPPPTMVPQVVIDGVLIGGADALKAHLA